jgi:hypothetical protein
MSITATLIIFVHLFSLIMMSVGATQNHENSACATGVCVQQTRITVGHGIKSEKFIFILLFSEYLILYIYHYYHDNFCPSYLRPYSLGNGANQKLVSRGRVLQPEKAFISKPDKSLKK